MNPGQHLHEQGYQLEAELHHNELIPFVLTHLLRKNAVTIFFLVVNLFFCDPMAYCLFLVFVDW